MSKTKTPTIIRVTWIDAYSSEGPKTIEDADEMSDGAVMHSSGFMISRRGKSVKLARDHQPGLVEAFRDIMVIPKKYIVDIKEMK